MMHLAGFYQSVDPAGALTQIDAITDQAVFTNGVNLRIPAQIANLLAEAGLTKATTPKFAQVQSPSLRQLANQGLLPIGSADTFVNPMELQWHGESPRTLQGSEALNFAIKATGGAAADNYGLVWLGDGPVTRAQGKMFSVHGTTAITLAAGSWVNGAITFDDTLPSGMYQVVGLRVQSANLVAARLVFVGAAWRPGVIGDTGNDTQLMPNARYGGMGVLGTFSVDQPPTIDALGATDTAQDVILDLIKTA